MRAEFYLKESWFVFSGFRIREGNPVLYALIGVDVTVQHQREDELIQAHGFLDSLMQAIPLPVFHKDRQGRYTGVNSAFEDFFGIEQADIKGKNVYDINPDALAEVYHRRDLELLQNGGVQVYQSEVVDRNGATHQVEFHKSVFNDRDGNSSGIIGVVQDLTEMKARERELLIHRWSLDSSQNAVALADLSGEITYVNEAFCRLWHISGRTQVIGSRVDQFWLDPQAAGQVVEALQQQGRWNGELSAKRDDGEIRTMQVAAGVIRDEQGTPVCMQASFIDITEQQQLQKSLEESARENRLLLRELQHRAKNSFVMLGGLINMYQTGEENSACARILQSLYSRVESVAELYELLYSADTVSVVDLKDYLTGLLDRQPVPDRISIKKELQSCPLDTKNAIQVGLIVNELVTNSLKYGFPDNRNGVISVSLSCSDGFIELVVKDDGAGNSGGSLFEEPRASGVNLIRMLVEGMKGELEQLPGSGIGVQIRFRCQLSSVE